MAKEKCPECKKSFKKLKIHWGQKHKGMETPIPKVHQPATGEEFDLFSDDNKEDFTLDISKRNLGEINNLQNEMEIKEFKKQIVDLEQKNKDLIKKVETLEKAGLTKNRANNETVKKYNELLENAEVINDLLEDYEESEEILKLADLQKLSEDRTELPVDDSMVQLLINFVNKICDIFDFDKELIPAQIKFEAIYFTLFDRFDQLKKILEGVQTELEK